MISDKEDPDRVQVIKELWMLTRHLTDKNEQYCFRVPKKPAKPVEASGKVIRPFQGASNKYE